MNLKPYNTLKILQSPSESKRVPQQITFKKNIKFPLKSIKYQANTKDCSCFSFHDKRAFFNAYHSFFNVFKKQAVAAVDAI